MLLAKSFPRETPALKGSPGGSGRVGGVGPMVSIECQQLGWRLNAAQRRQLIDALTPLPFEMPGLAEIERA